MADNFCHLSSFLEIPEQYNDIVPKLIEHIINEIDNLSDHMNYIGVNYRFITSVSQNGIWFYDDCGEADENDVEMIARYIIEELKLDGVFYCSWAYICSKPRIDEFGGGAFAIKRGSKTVWCDAMDYVMSQMQCDQKDK